MSFLFQLHHSSLVFRLCTVSTSAMAAVDNARELQSQVDAAPHQDKPFAQLDMVQSVLEAKEAHVRTLQGARDRLERDLDAANAECDRYPTQLLWSQYPPCFGMVRPPDIVCRMLFFMGVLVSWDILMCGSWKTRFSNLQSSRDAVQHSLDEVQSELDEVLLCRALPYFCEDLCRLQPCRPPASVACAV